MTDTCFLYLLVHASEPAFKIGVSNNVQSRMSDIGEPILEAESLAISAPRNRCFDTEKVLHRLLAKYRLPAKQRDGGTEWFSKEGWSRALEILSFIGEDIGIGSLAPLPPKPALQPRQPKPKAPSWKDVPAEERDELIERNRTAIDFFCHIMRQGHVLRVWYDEPGLYIVTPRMDPWVVSRTRIEAGRLYMFYLIASSYCDQNYSVLVSYPHDWLHTPRGVDEVFYTAEQRQALMGVAAGLLEREIPGLAEASRMAGSLDELWRVLGLEAKA